MLLLLSGTASLNSLFTRAAEVGRACLELGRRLDNISPRDADRLSLVGRARSSKVKGSMSPNS